MNRAKSTTTTRHGSGSTNSPAIASARITPGSCPARHRRGDLSQGNLEGLGIAGLIVGALQVYAGAYYRVLEGWAFTGLVLNIVIILILSLRHDEFVYERR